MEPGRCPGPFPGRQHGDGVRGAEGHSQREGRAGPTPTFSKITVGEALFSKPLTADLEMEVDEFSKVFNVAAPKVCERWVGTYATAPGQQWFVAAPEPQVRLTVVTTGAGMSTAFGIGEKVVQDRLAYLTGKLNLTQSDLDQIEKILDGIDN